MSRRRTSGEIINATLLEIFLALSFIVFGLAVFEKQRANAAEAALRRAPSGSDVEALRDSLDAARSAAATHADSLAAAQTELDNLRLAKVELDSLRFASRYPPDCEPEASPAEFLTVTLGGGGQLTVTIHRAAFGFTAGTTFTVTTAQFAQRFAEVREYSRANGCRYLVRIRDTERTSKDEYKRALSAINTTFRLRDFLR
jgi:hypothetical protein